MSYSYLVPSLPVLIGQLGGSKGRYAKGQAVLGMVANRKTQHNLDHGMGDPGMTSQPSVLGSPGWGGSPAGVMIWSNP